MVYILDLALKMPPGVPPLSVFTSVFLYKYENVLKTQAAGNSLILWKSEF
jgi:hypothetical protein